MQIAEAWTYEIKAIGSQPMPSPSESRPWGSGVSAKGIGEAATIGATPTATNAVIDALSAFGITHLDIPFTPEKVWTAIQGASRGE